MTITVELPDDVAAALEKAAKAHGLTAERWLHRIIEEKLRLEGIDNDRPVSEMIRDLWADMPDDVRAKLPSDGASQVDHYVYGLPKRDE
ncbi:MAG TPA: hypothetical protein VLU25_08285 [Acidobacteriota bacterium]|nr:hypothetical protein [Acidobacteriota bacterium]